MVFCKRGSTRVSYVLKTSNQGDDIIPNFEHMITSEYFQKRFIMLLLDKVSLHHLVCFFSRETISNTFKPDILL